MENRIPIKGGCHCGNIEYTYYSPLPAEEIPIRGCNCSFCTKQGHRYTSHPHAKLEASIRDPSQVKAIRFGTETAEFHLCQACGVIPFITSRIDDQNYAVVNVNSFDGIDLATLNMDFFDLNNESLEARLERRKRVWIPEVLIPNTGAEQSLS